MFSGCFFQQIDHFTTEPGSVLFFDLWGQPGRWKAGMGNSSPGKGFTASSLKSLGTTGADLAGAALCFCHRKNGRNVGRNPPSWRIVQLVVKNWDVVFFFFSHLKWGHTTFRNRLGLSRGLQDGLFVNIAMVKNSHHRTDFGSWQCETGQTSSCFLQILQV